MSRITPQISGKADIFVLKFPDGYPVGGIKFGFEDSPRRITGAQKVVQTFLLCLLTPKGSDLFRPNAGTTFLNYTMRSNISRDTQRVAADLKVSIQDATNQAKSILNSRGAPLDSQLSSVEDISVEVGDESTYIGMTVRTKAGRQVTIAVPFPQTDLNIRTDV